MCVGVQHINLEIKVGDRLEYGKFDDFVCSITKQNAEKMQIVDFSFDNGNKVDEDCFELDYFALTSTSSQFCKSIKTTSPQLCGCSAHKARNSFSCPSCHFVVSSFVSKMEIKLTKIVIIYFLN
jgi:hypothetical protein